VKRRAANLVELDGVDQCAQQHAERAVRSGGGLVEPLVLLDLEAARDGDSPGDAGRASAGGVGVVALACPGRYWHERILSRKRRSCGDPARRVVCASLARRAAVLVALSGQGTARAAAMRPAHRRGASATPGEGGLTWDSGEASCAPDHGKRRRCLRQLARGEHDTLLPS